MIMAGVTLAADLYRSKHRTDQMATTGKAALFAQARPGGRVKCSLCPRYCNIPPGKTAFCHVRHNHDGTLYNVAYGRPTAVHVDPVEKKPLFHFLPGTTILSLGSAGCNMACRFCQNWDLARADEVQRGAVDLPPDRVVELTLRSGCRSIAFTYNEPTILAEYVMDTAALARQAGLRTVMVTNGYITREAIPLVYRHVDAANVDIKAFDDVFYRKRASAHLQPVLGAIEFIRDQGVWIEITTLLIEGMNTKPDGIRAEVDWILEHLGPDVPLHFSAFHPDYRMLDRPRTSPASLAVARRIARDAGLRFVYEGNVHSDGGHTVCPGCGEVLIHRDWHNVSENRLTPDHRCPQCGESIPMA